MDQSNYECSICLDVINNSKTIRLEECKHVFHKSCIKLWYKKSNTCPICRKPIKDIFRIKFKSDKEFLKKTYLIDLQENKVVIFNLVKLKKNNKYLELSEFEKTNNILCDLKDNERIGNEKFIILYEDFTRIEVLNSYIVFKNFAYNENINKNKAIKKNKKCLKFKFSNGSEACKFLEILKKRHQYFRDFNY
tara:strand:+ start:2503 stop:3078 length:576 start_codon:yes stop_codon:yes gene_type:complete